MDPKEARDNKNATDLKFRLRYRHPGSCDLCLLLLPEARELLEMLILRYLRDKDKVYWSDRVKPLLSQHKHCFWRYAGSNATNHRHTRIVLSTRQAQR